MADMTRADNIGPEAEYPTCPTCASEGPRCIDTDGSLVWPWHVRRQVVDAAAYLSSDRVAMNYTDTLTSTTELVNAYLAGVSDGRHGTPVIERDYFIGQIEAALVTLREALDARR